MCVQHQQRDRRAGFGRASGVADTHPSARLPDAVRGARAQHRWRCNLLTNTRAAFGKNSALARCSSACAARDAESCFELVQIVGNAMRLSWVGLQLTLVHCARRLNFFETCADDVDPHVFLFWANESVEAMNAG